MPRTGLSKNSQDTLRIWVIQQWFHVENLNRKPIETSNPTWSNLANHPIAMEHGPFLDDPIQPSDL